MTKEEQRLKYSRDKAYREKRKQYSRNAYRKIPREKLRVYANRRREELKKEVLTHYGKLGKLMCCWRGCTVCDLDMLSLDHIKDDGAKHRSSKGNRTCFCGKEIYYWVKRNSYPKDFQTLCMNHQYKKQRIKNRKNLKVPVNAGGRNQHAELHS